MINFIFGKLLVEIQTSHEKLVKCKTRRKKEDQGERGGGGKGEVGNGGREGGRGREGREGRWRELEGRLVWRVGVFIDRTEKYVFVVTINCNIHVYCYRDYCKVC